MNPKCRVILQLDDPNAPVKQESLWAQARAAGRYALLNSSFFMPLAVGDIVEATSHGQRLTVVGLDRAGVMTSSLVAVDASVSDFEKKQVTDGWRTHGASWTEGAFGLLSTVWRPTATADEVHARLTRELRRRAGWRVVSVHSPDDRRRLMAARVAPQNGGQVIDLAEYRARSRTGRRLARM